MNSKVFIRIKDKSMNIESEEITIEDLIYNQDIIEFVFPNFTEEYEDGSKCTYDLTLPYDDFLFFQDKYEVIVRIGEEKDNDNIKMV